MITKILHDCVAFDGEEQIPIERGTPVEFQDWVAARHPAYPQGTELAEVTLPGGSVVAVPASAVDAHEPEESLSALAKSLGVPYDTLARYAREGRIIARKSGGVWLSTRTAVEYASINVR